jgi:hypothetical protein
MVMKTVDEDPTLPQMHFVTVRLAGLGKDNDVAISCTLDRDAAWAAVKKFVDRTIYAYGAGYCPICTAVASARPVTLKPAVEKAPPSVEKPVEPGPRPPDVKVVTW